MARKSTFTRTFSEPVTKHHAVYRAARKAAREAKVATDAEHAAVELTKVELRFIVAVEEGTGQEKSNRTRVFNAIAAAKDGITITELAKATKLTVAQVKGCIAKLNVQMRITTK